MENWLSSLSLCKPSLHLETILQFLEIFRLRNIETPLLWLVCVCKDSLPLYISYPLPAPATRWLYWAGSRCPPPRPGWLPPTSHCQVIHHQQMFISTCKPRPEHPGLEVRDSLTSSVVKWLIIKSCRWWQWISAVSPLRTDLSTRV